MNMPSLFHRRRLRRYWPAALALLICVAVAVVVVAANTSGAAPQKYHCPMHPNYVSDKPGDCPVCGMRLVPMQADESKATPTGQKEPQRAGAAVSTDVYTCPMHPDVVSDKPGKCPICGMNLVKKARAKDVYTCPMHPEVVSDKPGKCPKCGMNLVKKAPTAEPDKKLSESTAPGSAPAPGLQPVDVEAGRAALAGIRTVAATSDTVTSTVRAVGTVAVDETRVRRVTTKVAGWVEKLYVNAVGQAVTAGQPLFELYSPELLASQEEYVRARQSVREFSGSTLSEVRRGGEDLVSSARRRLELFDVPADFLTELERSGTVRRTVVFRAPFTGYVSEKNLLEGDKIEPGENLFAITDYSRVWIVAQLYEAEADVARVGRHATVRLPYDTSTVLDGRIGLVYPTMDVETRTLRVRFEFANPRLRLKPGMFVDVSLDTSAVPGVVVPDSAVMDTGTRQIVFVESGVGHFEPRDVVVGQRADGRVALRSGLRAGERVAVAANFLLDSESRLRGALIDATTPSAAEPHQHR
jgi:Cu(I)/Ag(I) efflux system membrane fusion protein